MEKDNGEIADEIFGEMEAKKLEPTEDQKSTEADFFNFQIEGAEKRTIWKTLLQTVEEKKKIQKQIKELKDYNKRVVEINRKLREAYYKK